MHPFSTQGVEQGTLETNGLKQENWTNEERLIVLTGMNYK